MLTAPTRPVDPGTARRALIAGVRSTGNQGGRIGPHRAIATVHLTRGDVGLAILASIVLTVAYAASLGVVGRLWSAIFHLLAEPLALGGVAQHTAQVAPFAHITVPYFTVAAGPPSWLVWWATLFATLVAVVVSIVLRARFLPLAYGIRFVAAIQASALLFFGVAPHRFPYQLGSYVSDMLVIGATVIGLVPLVLGLTFYVMDVRWSQKLALTAVVMGHLLVFVPLQYAVQTYVIAHGSLLFLPVGFIVFGILPEVMIVISLYGWGMSWAPEGRRRRRQ